ncbi:DUF2500 domain-containing protein [Paenibacillus sp. 19GGS1-52]|uniref:DUF2500 domain-containing protein n=1 Tax=Paenibacillus sp. 19GGS1-52 TaxID=2758563 RepID=UPI001EFA3B9A|nr:DUF2500 domain-containing protein [Paenibacillus sp. 19GGS1-52]
MNGSDSFMSSTPLFFKLFFLIIVGFFIFIIVRMVNLWMSNNASPLVIARCTAVTKRTEVWGGSGDTGASTSYYVTFELENGSRVELQVQSRVFGLIVEGDLGELSYQGSRFKGFRRVEETAY